ncbi:MAG: OmpA family protein [Muribaculaceae bacterium]|nr:OmpA family protein [Muribaculaceae bacterium]MDE6771180.1 OmpA family protein [Muribaculaceae bacterium]
MKILRNFTAALLALAMLAGASGCSSMTNTGKGALIGGGGGAAVGAGIGALIGGGKGAGIGSAIGAAVGAGAGALIGKNMDKQQKELEEQLAQQAKVEQTTDSNGLQAIKVTFDGGILFQTGKYNLNESAQTDLTKFAVNLIQNPNTDVAIVGYTDNTGSYAVNEKLSDQRANSVRNYLIKCGVNPSRLTAIGIPMADYVASNDTPEGRALNRRVELTIYANEKMIKEAEAQASN